VLTIGEFARAARLSPKALRLYDELGLLTPARVDPASGYRLYEPGQLERARLVAWLRRLGMPLARIRDALDGLPAGRTPTRSDWARLSAGWREELDARIAGLQALRDRLSVCIGCGCLSLQICKLSNPDDLLGNDGPGPRRLGG